jgi:hypothetical protein
MPFFTLTASQTRRQRDLDRRFAHRLKASSSAPYTLSTSAPYRPPEEERHGLASSTAGGQINLA